MWHNDHYQVDGSDLFLRRRRHILFLGVLLQLVVSDSAVALDLSNLSVPADEILSGGPPKDGIPALTDPEAVPAAEASFLQPSDRVLGVPLGGHSRAYPIRILNWHEVVNDRVGGSAIVVTYCPLCGTGMVFRAEAKGKRLYFGVSGLLYNSDVLLYDRETESLWSQLGMKAISGTCAGDTLEWLTVEHTTWKHWVRQHPNTDVLSLQTGYRRDYDRNPYADYDRSDRLLFPVANQDDRLPRKAWVVGVLRGKQAKAYPFRVLEKNPAITDEVNGEKISVLFNPEVRSARVVDARGDPIPSVQAYWFAWFAFHPDTALYSAD
jgi:hypothetical protein